MVDMNRLSLSQEPFSDSDFSDGEIYRLVPGSIQWTALTTETWLNCSPDTRDHFVRLLLAPHYFAGTMLSLTRRQLELTVIPFANESSEPGNIQVISITLNNFHRFI